METPFPDEPKALNAPPSPEPAGLRHPGEPPAEMSTAGVSRPGDNSLVAEASSEGRVGDPTRPSRPPFLSPALVAAELREQGITAVQDENGGVRVSLDNGLVALRLPTSRPDWQVDASEATGVRDLLNRIEWVERDGDMASLFVRIDRPELLAAHATVRNAVVVAELVVAGTVSLGHLARGSRGTVTQLTEAEALSIGDLLDWSSEEASAPLPQATDIRTLATDTARVRLAYNRDNPDAVLRDGVVFRAFDLLEGAAEEVAAKLEEDGDVQVRPPHLRASSIISVPLDDTVDAVVRRIVDILVSAVQEADASLPLVLAEPGTKGSPARLLSVTPSGEVVRWDTNSDLHTLVLLAVQPMRGERYESGIPATLLGRIALELRAAAHQVTNIVFEPTIIGDDIVTTPGYHRRAKAVLTMPHRDRRRWAVEYSVPARPSIEEAQAAFDLLDLELCDSFPWAEPRDRARYMAALLTGAARSAVDVSPGFVVDADDIGSGKSASMEAVRLVAQGSMTTAEWTLGRGVDEESKKSLASALLTRSTRFFHNDEVRGPINSPAVGKIITGGDDTETIRELGGNRLVTVRGIIVTACGNNVTFSDDHARRWFRIRLEKPLLQMATGGKYRHPNLEAYIRANRPALVAAAHTLVLRAIQQGPAYQLKGYGFRPSWSQRILGALTWVTSDGKTVAAQAVEGWEKDVAGADHHAEQWGEPLAYTWRHLSAPVSASEFARITLTSKGELGLDDELMAASRRQLGARWSRALKNLRGKKVIVGDRVYRVTAEDANGRWLFDVEAYDLTALLEHRQEPLTRPPLTEPERNLFKAAMSGGTF
ncbi:hypothetical protein [Microbacterium sp. RU33B]|uniref:hypothetical protein n=1 Tax=Microbacterium sp. RU33B TaxID=1907390 RepID=UPI00095D9A90|nr:hypothetical protein [Microbacterium sp. RU33B]SIT72601.1 hypothetical protein SAMN05880545_1079 [Microbacterium sp. RU33B]